LRLHFRISASFVSNNGGTGTGSDDLLSSFTDDPFSKKFESSVNLGDSVSPSLTQTDLGSLDGFKSNSEFDKLLSDGYSMGFPDSLSGLGSENGVGTGKVDAISSESAIENNKHHTGDAKEGIGSKLEDVQGSSSVSY